MNQKRLQIKSHEIIEDSHEDSSQMMSLKAAAAKASETEPAALNKHDEADKVGIEENTGMRHRHPQVMRFCPSLSSPEVDISLSGKS